MVSCSEIHAAPTPSVFNMPPKILQQDTDLAIFFASWLTYWSWIFYCSRNSCLRSIHTIERSISDIFVCFIGSWLLDYIQPEFYIIDSQPIIACRMYYTAMNSSGQYHHFEISTVLYADVWSVVYIKLRLDLCLLLFSEPSQLIPWL